MLRVPSILSYTRQVHPARGLFAGMSSNTPLSTQHADASGYTAAEYQRRAEHKSRTGQEETNYVLTLSTDHEHHKYLTSLRDKYFPKHINKLEAHIALFRAIPGSKLPQVKQDIQAIAQTHKPFKIQADRPFQMAHGIGVNVRRSAAEDLFSELKGKWEPFLSSQDHQFHAHYTIQNKVDDKGELERCFHEVQAEFRPSVGVVHGLALYRYDKGYWKDRIEFPFEGEAESRGP